MTGKEYAITTDIDYVAQICDQDSYINEYKESKDYLFNNGYKYLLPELEKLYNANYLGYSYEIDHYRTIEHIIKEINKITK